MRVVAVALAVVLAPAFAAAAADEHLPSGCETSGAGFRCRWEIEAPATAYYAEFEIPVFPRTLVTLTTTLEGRDLGWTEIVFEAANDTRRVVSLHPKSADENAVRPIHRSTSQHLILAQPGATYILGISNSATTSVGNGQAGLFVAGSSGSFVMTYEATPLPAGEAPARPAATRADPHLAGVADDARFGAYDLVAAWMNDAALGDGLFDVHVAVSNVTDFGWSDTTEQISWNLSWTLRGERYAVVWDVTQSEASPDGLSLTCYLTRFRPGGVEFIMTPPCELDRSMGVLSAVLPEVALGSPGDGVPFEGLAAAAHTHDAELSSVEDVRPGLREEDAITVERYPFALGGPPVWDELNPRLAAVETTSRSPLAVLAGSGVPALVRVASVLGVVALALAILLARRGQEGRRLVEEVDLAVWAHRDDAAAGLIALGRLEDRFDELYRAGAIRSAAYRRASARLAAAATRFAMRRELGLDTGHPGEGRARLRP